MHEGYLRLSLTHTSISGYINIVCGCLETIASLQAFRKRHAEAQRVLDSLKGQPTTVNIAKYRGTLRNQAIVNEAEKLLNEFKPVTYDVNSHIKAIEKFETKAVGCIFYHCWRCFDVWCG